MIGRIGCLLGNILFSVLERYGLTGRVWAFPFFQIHVFGPNKSGFCLSGYGGTRGRHGPPCSFGLASGILGPFLSPYQLPPSPCVQTAWARAVIIPATVAISTCLLGYGLIKPDRRHTWYVNDGPLGFALVFHTPLVFPCFLSTSPVLSSFGPIPSPFFFISWCSCISFSPGFSSVYLVLGPFLAFFFSPLIPGPATSPSLRALFDWCDEALGFSRLDFVYTVRLRHGSESFFFFAYRR